MITANYKSHRQSKGRNGRKANDIKCAMADRADRREGRTVKRKGRATLPARDAVALYGITRDLGIAGQSHYFAEPGLPYKKLVGFRWVADGSPVPGDTLVRWEDMQPGCVDRDIEPVFE